MAASDVARAVSAFVAVACAGHAPSITVVGSVNLDLVARVERLPRPGETVTNASFERVPGGKGANQAVAAARLGAEVRLVCSVGRDTFADEALPREAGLELADAAGRRADRRRAHPRRRAGENQIVVAPARTRCSAPSNWSRATPCCASSRSRTQRFWAPGAGERALLPERRAGAADRRRCRSHRRQPLRAGGAPPPRRPDRGHARRGGRRAARGRGGGGARGAATGRRGHGTAAGDAFTACLLVGLLEGRTREEALRRACAAGAIAASRFGAQPSLPTVAELDAILAA